MKCMLFVKSVFMLSSLLFVGTIYKQRELNAYFVSFARECLVQDVPWFLFVIACHNVAESPKYHQEIPFIFPLTNSYNANLMEHSLLCVFFFKILSSSFTS